MPVRRGARRHGTIIGAGVDTILANALPGDVVITMAVRIAGSAEEFAEFEVKASVSGPNLETVLEHTYPPVLLSISTNDPRIDAAWTLPMALAFPAESEGVYTITLEIGDGGIATNSVLVRLADSPPPTPEPE